MIEQLKPEAWLIDDSRHCTGIEVACDERADVIQYWQEEGKAVPLYAIPEGFYLLPIKATQEMVDAVRSEDYTWSIEGMYRIMTSAFMDKQQ